MDERAQNQLIALVERIGDILNVVGFMLEESPEESADKMFTTFLLTQLAKERGLLDDNCNRAVVKALHAIGLEEHDVPLYLQEKRA